MQHAIVSYRHDAVRRCDAKMGCRRRPSPTRDPGTSCSLQFRSRRGPGAARLGIHNIGRTRQRRAFVLALYAIQERRRRFGCARFCWWRNRPGESNHLTDSIVNVRQRYPHAVNDSLRSLMTVYERPDDLMLQRRYGVRFVHAWSNAPETSSKCLTIDRYAASRSS